LLVGVASYTRRAPATYPPTAIGGSTTQQGAISTMRSDFKGTITSTIAGDISDAPNVDLATA